MPGVESTSNGSQFTYFLTAPMQAFCQLAGITSDIDSVCTFLEESSICGILISIFWALLLGFQDTYANAEIILFSALEQYEGILCTSVGLNNVWGQILPDPFLRRLIVRYLFPYISTFNVLTICHLVGRLALHHRLKIVSWPLPKHESGYLTWLVNSTQLELLSIAIFPANRRWACEQVYGGVKGNSGRMVLQHHTCT